MARFRFLLLLTLFLGIAAARAEACGDKFLTPGKVPQFNQVFASIHPGRILLYRNASSEVATSVMNEDLKQTLERVGHIVEVVESPDELAEALNSGPYDLVLVDANDIENIEVPAGSVPPMLLPVLYKAPWAEVLEFQKTYRVVINAPTRASQAVSVIDEAMNLHRVG